MDVPSRSRNFHDVPRVRIPPISQSQPLVNNHYPFRIDDYMALWKLIAYYLGTPLYPFATSSLAKAYMESILSDGMAPTATSQLLSQNIIASLAGHPPSYASPEFLTAQARYVVVSLYSRSSASSNVHIDKVSV